MRRHALLLLAAVTLAPRAEAQIVRPAVRPPEPKTWMSFSVGAMDLTDIHDGSTNTEWLFGNTVQYRISLEMPVAYQSTFGISGAFARVPITYQQLNGAGGIASSEEDADATVTQLMATLHAGRTSIGLHQIIDISVGAIGYSAFRGRASGERLAPRQLDADICAGIGYGFGYAMSPDMQVTLVQEAFASVHQRGGIAAGENQMGGQFVLRLGTRFGF